MLKKTPSSTVRTTYPSLMAVATEIGMLHRLRKEAPGKVFQPVSEEAVCKYMKMITLDKVLRALREEVYEVKVPEETAAKARLAIERMLQHT